MFMEKHLDYPTFKGGVVNGDELRSALTPEIGIYTHFLFALRTLVTSCDQLQSACNRLQSRAIDVQLTCDDICQPKCCFYMGRTDYLGCP